MKLVGVSHRQSSDEASGARLESPEASPTAEPAEPTEKPEASLTAEPAEPTEKPEASPTAEPAEPTEKPEAPEGYKSEAGGATSGSSHQEGNESGSGGGEHG